jgi:predicted nucleic-acid-binding Zn-ribbon protein
MSQQCIICGSSKVREVNAEVAFANGKASPVYSLQKPAVCLECGYTECRIPKDSLSQLRELLAPAQ